MRIAIGTTKKPKIDGVKEGIAECPYLSKIETIEYITQKVESDVSDMPLDINETMQWAKNRARNIKKLWIDADFYIGIEWWINTMWEKSYLGGVMYIENSDGVWHFWFSPFIEIPQTIHKRLFENKEELWPIMSELSGIVDIGSENGSMWAWSNDMFTRKDEFSVAFKAAIAPFFNTYYTL